MNSWRFIVGGVLVAGLAVAGWQMLGPSRMPQGHAMAQPDTSTVTQGAEIVQVAVPDSLSERAEIGKVAYDAKCAVCHGTNAAGQNGVAPPLVHKIYEPGHHSDAAFLVAASNGVRAHHWNFGNMPPVEGVTQGDVKMIIAYVRELQRANGIN